MSEGMNLDAMVRSAAAVAQRYPPEFTHPIVLARLLSGMLVPALKQVSGYNQQPRIYTHQNAMTTAATAGVSDTETIRFTANSDFLMTGMSMINGDNGATAYTYDFQMIFGANDRNLVNRAQGIHAQALMGADQVPWAFPKAFAIRKNSTLTVKITNIPATAIGNCFVYLFGIDYLDGNVLDATRRSIV